MERSLTSKKSLCAFAATSVISGRVEGEPGRQRVSGSFAVVDRVPVNRREKKPGGRPPLLTVEISLPEVEELQKPVQEGLDKGGLTYDEIAAGLEAVELTTAQ